MKLIKPTILGLSVIVTFSFVVLSGEHSNKAPEGVQMKGDDRAVAKSGYEFYRVNDRQVGVRRKVDGKVVEGRFWCGCTAGDLEKGTCSFFVDKETVTCKPYGGCTKCKLSTQPPIKVQ
jgi:hypothetical protein